LKNKRS